MLLDDLPARVANGTWDLFSKDRRDYDHTQLLRYSVNTSEAAPIKKSQITSKPSNKAVTVSDSHPLAHVDSPINQLHGFVFFSCLDHPSGYW